MRAERWKMKCLVCHRNMKKSEQVFLGTTVTYDGPEEYDFSHIQAQNDLEGVVHLICLKNAPQTTTELNEPVDGELVVQRSDALGLLMG